MDSGGLASWLSHLIAFTDSERNFPQSIELIPGRHYDAKCEFANDLFQLLIEFEERHSMPTFGPGLATGSAALHGSRFVCSAFVTAS